MMDDKEQERVEKTREITSDLIRACFSSAKNRGVKADDEKTAVFVALMAACVVMAKRFGFDKQRSIKAIDQGWDYLAEVSDG